MQAWLTTALRVLRPLGSGPVGLTKTPFFQCELTNPAWEPRSTAPGTPINLEGPASLPTWGPGCGSSTSLLKRGPPCSPCAPLHVC